MVLLRYIKEMANSPFFILMGLYRYRHILQQMTIIEIKSRFVGSVGGLMWHFAHPLLMVCIYLFVFVYIFKLRLGEGGSTLSAVFILSGLFPWIILSEGITRGTSSLLESANLIQKTFFPTEILPAKAVITPFINYGITIFLLTVYVSLSAGLSIFKLSLLTLAIICQIIFTFGTALATSTVSVFFRDMVHIVQILTTVGLYLTPILYPVSFLPKWAIDLLYLNPVYPFASTYQYIFTGAFPLKWQIIGLMIGWSTVTFMVGAFLFYKMKYEFADWL